MTLNEFKTKVAESPNKEWLQDYSFDLELSHLNINLSFKGFVSIYEFILRQIEGYKTLSQLPEEFETVSKTFISARNRMITLLNNNTVSEYDWKNSLTGLNKTNPLIFLYDSPETIFLIKVNSDYPDYYPGAYEFITGNIHHYNDINYLSGYFLAYEFKSKDFSSLVERKEAEKKSISRIRVDFQKALINSETHLVDYLQQANQKYVDYATKIDVFQKDKETAYTEWFKKIATGFDQFHIASDNKVKELEKLYKEKLKLEAPAKYWSDRAKKLRKEGNRWLVGLIICIGITVGILVWVLNKIADGTIEEIFHNTGIAIKWSIALITLISFLAYGVRIFSKLTFSSFHLVRDAEEREQLTYVYLALQKEKGIDQTERHLIMQSLFSRADSGLLKDDASPTMPGNIVDQMTRK
jgi:hypothetical protein